MFTVPFLERELRIDDTRPRHSGSLLKITITHCKTVIAICSLVGAEDLLMRVFSNKMGSPETLCNAPFAARGDRSRILSCRGSLPSHSNMRTDDHILISLEPRHADNIFSGLKRVELRRRSMNVDPSSKVWIYSTLPVGSIVGYARISQIHVLSPATLWHRFGAVSAITRHEFFDYFGELSQGVALELTGARKLEQPVNLSFLRKVHRKFHPPQFFCRLRHGPLLEAITDLPLAVPP